jgi:hypothetical protein
VDLAQVTVTLRGAEPFVEPLVGRFTALDPYAARLQQADVAANASALVRDQVIHQTLGEIDDAKERMTAFADGFSADAPSRLRSTHRATEVGALRGLTSMQCAAGMPWRLSKRRFPANRQRVTNATSAQRRR